MPDASSATGYDNPMPYTGLATADSFHDITSTPEPGVAMIGVAGLGTLLRRRR